MKRSRFTPEQITAILAQVEGGKTVADVVREHGIAEKTYYKSQVRRPIEPERLRELEEENRDSSTSSPTRRSSSPC